MAVNTEVRITDWGGNPQLTGSRVLIYFCSCSFTERNRAGTGTLESEIKDETARRFACIPLETGATEMCSMHKESVFSRLGKQTSPSRMFESCSSFFHAPGRRLKSPSNCSHSGNRSDGYPSPKDSLT